MDNARGKVARTMQEEKLHGQCKRKSCTNNARGKVARTVQEEKLHGQYKRKSCTDNTRGKVAHQLIKNFCGLSF